LSISSTSLLRPTDHALVFRLGRSGYGGLIDVHGVVEMSEVNGRAGGCGCGSGCGDVRQLEPAHDGVVGGAAHWKAMESDEMTQELVARVPVRAARRYRTHVVVVVNFVCLQVLEEDGRLEEPIWRSEQV
jgi:hypothetical protein